MSYQRPPDYQAGAAGTANPPGWYLDPIGLQSLRWWDGARWARDTQPLLGPAGERPSPYPDAIASGYGAFRQPGAGSRRQLDGRQRRNHKARGALSGLDDHGAVGTALNHVFRLLDAPVLKKALAESGGDLGLVVSELLLPKRDPAQPHPD